MNNLSFLEILFRTKGYQKVMDLIIAERERIITYEEFLYVLNEVNVIKDLADCDYYSISGSGGRHKQPPFDKFVVILFYRISPVMSSFFLKKIMALARNEFHYQHQKLYNQI